MADKAAADGGFTGAYIAGKEDYAPLAAYSIEQVGQRLPVQFAHIEVLRVRGDGKGFFGQAEIACIHAMMSAAVRLRNRACHA